ncbi:pyridoxal phosphate-dependent aminotransferase [Poseidonibacter ostreae]|jgi:threonine-phosphate decarboxylase|uniref:Aminotransferase class I/II-fold pyridoxal phosphate-dependent enzyme n=1 Tax=Poseidonibacter ostreae TaxID=2654171 RepID=A0A6L4WT56_9BACT|nr:aminotransferase class I/II-fold pyridoxal phosphate-dependent enzyme [Poseidonibacter ostreae]KAB7886665.1 aminotransferase class I/II-fold pyridoxal phosphate-dependent enzyme [Poseidonibacter ostreae]KAB7889057.1 aminotransferase class I/II-fold pyridoxal phosphate-dependent enzyme [Poseidonibacter ostreae]KAB7891804.1 aminotransferase class I/II-fold pyridoxal phosphate-dependent enzyme [Poseidonibacter ostreae]
MKTYEHGGQIESFANDLNCEVKEIIDLSSNINFIKPEVNIDFNNLDISAYPIYDKLYEKIANNYKVKPSQIELFNGGSSAIFSLFKHLNLKHCTIYSPAYLEYKKACINFGYELRTINRFENISLPVKDESLVIFVNPSTPDGTYYDLDILINYWIEKNCTILIDESFLDFCDGNSAIKYLKKYDKLYILKSMTKFYSSAGIRVGTIVSNEKNIDSLKRFEPMWKLSHFDSNYLQAALDDINFKRISKAINIKNRIELENVLENTSLVESIYQSKANYILVKLKNINAKELQEKLKRYKIMIRDCSNFDYLDEYYIRVAVKSRTSIQIFKKALEEIC